MDTIEFAREILFGQTLKSKLISPKLITKKLVPDTNFRTILAPLSPGRNEKLSFSEGKTKFPKVSTFKSASQRAKAPHFFANHELLAIEMLAGALLIFPHSNQVEVNFKRSLIPTLEEEQLHLSLYIRRMEELGVTFGDFPLNNFFWDKMQNIKLPQEFICMLSLTFENANLDFAKFYQILFHGIGDYKSSSIMEKIYLDEIKHVSRGINWINQWRNDTDLWTYYQQYLPFPLTPARSKGPYFCQEARELANLPLSFIEKLKNYEDDFLITRRKKLNTKSPPHEYIFN